MWPHAAVRRCRPAIQCGTGNRDQGVGASLFRAPAFRHRRIRRIQGLEGAQRGSNHFGRRSIEQCVQLHHPIGTVRDVAASSRTGTTFVARERVPVSFLFGSGDRASKLFRRLLLRSGQQPQFCRSATAQCPAPGRPRDGTGLLLPYPTLRERCLRPWQRFKVTAKFRGRTRLPSGHAELLTHPGRGVGRTILLVHGQSCGCCRQPRPGHGQRRPGGLDLRQCRGNGVTIEAAEVHLRDPAACLCGLLERFQPRARRLRRPTAIEALVGAPVFTGHQETRTMAPHRQVSGGPSGRRVEHGRHQTQGV